MRKWSPYEAVEAKMIGNTAYVDARHLAEAVQEINRLTALIPCEEFVESREFYERMQAYRHARHDPVEEFDNIKKLIRFNYTPRQL